MPSHHCSTFRGLIAEHTTHRGSESPSGMINSRSPNQRRHHTGSTGVLFSISVRRLWLFFCVLLHRGLHPHLRKKTKQDFGTQRLVSRNTHLESICTKPLPFPSLPGRSVGFGTTHTWDEEEGGRRRFRGVEPWSLASVQNQPFLPEGKNTLPFRLTPDIILYRNRTINIYI